MFKKTRLEKEYVFRDFKLKLIREIVYYYRIQIITRLEKEFVSGYLKK